MKDPIYDSEDYTLIKPVSKYATLDIVSTLKHLDRKFAVTSGPTRRQIDYTMDQLEKELARRVDGTDV